MSFWRRHSFLPVLDEAAGLPDLGRAPELLGVGPWLNTPGGEPRTIELLRGRVVLIEFWTFQCGNCLRTLPFMRRVYDSYRGEIEVLGIHTPELPSERSPENVERAVQRLGLQFPIGIDNDFVAWTAYGNRYWPTQYLVDPAGRLRYAHVGEGAYRHTEAAVRALLAEPAGR